MSGQKRPDWSEGFCLFIINKTVQNKVKNLANLGYFERSIDSIINSGSFLCSSCRCEAQRDKSDYNWPENQPQKKEIIFITPDNQNEKSSKFWNCKPSWNAPSTIFFYFYNSSIFLCVTQKKNTNKFKEKQHVLKLKNVKRPKEFSSR